ncbi:MAG: SiaB family protein kinase [Bacteroidota bacterium]
MSKSTTLVDFEGAITFGTIEMLLNTLRDNQEFQKMNKPSKKRLYGIFVESIDNIFKYGAKLPGKSNNSSRTPKISVIRQKDQYFVRVGNLVLNDDIGDLKFKLDRVNQLDFEALKSLYEEVINKESSASDTGAGLGLITMAMRTDSDIEYSFAPVDADHSFFEMRITLNG